MRSSVTREKRAAVLWKVLEWASLPSGPCRNKSSQNSLLSYQQGTQKLQSGSLQVQIWRTTHQAHQRSTPPPPGKKAPLFLRLVQMLTPYLKLTWTLQEPLVMPTLYSQKTLLWALSLSTYRCRAPTSLWDPKSSLYPQAQTAHRTLSSTVWVLPYIIICIPHTYYWSSQNCKCGRGSHQLSFTDEENKVHKKAK